MKQRFLNNSILSAVLVLMAISLFIVKLKKKKLKMVSQSSLFTKGIKAQHYIGGRKSRNNRIVAFDRTRTCLCLAKKPMVFYLYVKLRE